MTNLKVLYVEDDEMIRMAFGNFLTRRVGSLFTARDGREGLQAFIDCRPDLVVTDVCMPDMDGPQMATLIRNIRHSVPIVFLTGSPERMAEFEGFDPAIDRVLVKPVNFPALFRLLEAYADNLQVPSRQWEC